MASPLADYARLALANIATEFPSHVSNVMERPGDFPARPRARNPVFYGSFDWHSCVEMHWVLARLLTAAPAEVPADDIRAALDRQFRPESLRVEAAFMASPHGARIERPYGWGWGLFLQNELADAWGAAMRPVSAAITENFLAWLPKATYPVRYGMHSNSAFGSSLALKYARRHDPRLAAAISEAALRWYGEDAEYPAAWEPSGHDFLSPALAEAELMAEVLPGPEFAVWLERFLPAVPESLLTPAVVSDPSDGQIAHLHGLNLSRAWHWRRLASSLPPSDPRVPVYRSASAVHAEAALPHVLAGDYMVTHWLVAYAVLMLFS